MNKEDALERTKNLVDIITAQEFVRTVETTYTQLIGPMSGDGHSFDDQYEEETVTESVDVYRPKYAWSERYAATAQLKRILSRTNDAQIRALCLQGIRHKNAESIGGGVIERFAFRLTCIVGLVGSFAVIIWAGAMEKPLELAYGKFISGLILVGGILAIFTLWFALYEWGCWRYRQGK